MFPSEKSIGAPVEITPGFRHTFETQNPAADDRKTFPAKTVTRGRATLHRGQQRLERLARKLARARLGPEPPMEGAADDRTGLAGDFGERQCARGNEGSEFAEPGVER